MSDNWHRNPIARSFHSNDVPRHQVHRDHRRPQRRVKHKGRVSWEGEE